MNTIPEGAARPELLTLYHCGFKDNLSAALWGTPSDGVLATRLCKHALTSSGMTWNNSGILRSYPAQVKRDEQPHWVVNRRRHCAVKLSVFVRHIPQVLFSDCGTKTARNVQFQECPIAVELIGVVCKECTIKAVSNGPVSIAGAVTAGILGFPARLIPGNISGTGGASISFMQQRVA